jgi:uncharacterized membrane protein YccC
MPGEMSRALGVSLALAVGVVLLYGAAVVRQQYPMAGDVLTVGVFYAVGVIIGWGSSDAR